MHVASSIQVVGYEILNPNQTHIFIQVHAVDQNSDLN